MNVSQTPTIGRSHRGNGGLEAMRELQTLLAQEDESPKPPSSSSEEEEEEDIDSETAMNTVYNLLTELGDLNRTNRRAAEELAAKFSVLQARVSQDGSSESMRIGTPVPGESSPGESYHTPIMEERVHVFPGVLPIRSPSVARGERGVQTDMGAGDIAMVELRLEEVEGENRGLREDVRRLVGAVREQQQMAGEYEGVLAKALGALRAAAFERHVEIGDVQVRYRELLDSEKSLNTRLAKENIELKVALGSAARLIRTSLADEDAGRGGVPPVDT